MKKDTLAGVFFYGHRRLWRVAPLPPSDEGKTLPSGERCRRRRQSGGRRWHGASRDGGRDKRRNLSVFLSPCLAIASAAPSSEGAKALRASTYENLSIDGGVWAPRPTTKPRAFRKPCRGRRLRPTEVPLGDDAPFQRAVPQGRDSPQRGEMSPQGDREEGGHFLALRAHSVDKRQPLQVLPRLLAIHHRAAQHTFLSCPLHLPQGLAELEGKQDGGEQHR